ATDVPRTALRDGQGRIRKVGCRDQGRGYRARISRASHADIRPAPALRTLAFSFYPPHGAAPAAGQAWGQGERAEGRGSAVDWTLSVSFITSMSASSSLPISASELSLRSIRKLRLHQ